MNKIEQRKMRLAQAEQLMASSLSVREWCKLNHVAESTMYVRLKVYREQIGETHTARNDWIEVSRAEAKQATALAVCDAAAAGRRSTQSKSSTAQHPQSFMRIIMNGACVEVVPGTCEADISEALRAVAAL